MAIRVLIVDDSRFFRKRITEILEADKELQVIDTAENGAEAVERVARHDIDVVVMDIEMPVMDGITAVRKIMAQNPVPILMFSSLTKEGAQATLDALDAGALDYLPKKFEDISKDSDEAKKILRTRVHDIAKKAYLARIRRKADATASAAVQRPQAVPGKAPAGKATFPADIRLVAIGTSTGGPAALQTVLTTLPANFPYPMILVQHMPGTFTGAFAQRLNQQCNIQIKEAENGDVLKPGCAYLAPGGKQMLLSKRGETLSLVIQDSVPGQTYKPCVDITFESVAKHLPGKVLGIILTGMGADGREGCRKLKQTGAVIWAQDEASSVIFGMPASVIEAGLADSVVSLTEVGETLVRGGR
ncbi:MAG: chemotaxis response regulator protein-glutamate methylesterase [Gammaproteobacteria bacterium RBG_16_57_12]|nr:MAG: chemotaxis response regulator protein-glutamate methylesterase [Gammaproteobacteria bacterium RBG_16_57_12]